MKGYYITFENPSHYNEGNGVYKKIQSQIKSFIKAGINISNINIPKNFKHLFKIINKFSPNIFLKNLPEDFFNVDFFYIRYSLCTYPFIKLLSEIKKNKKNVIIEIPTYPYNQEIKGFLSKLTLLMDSILNKQLKKYVNLITTYSKHTEIFNIPALQIMNGINISDIPVVTKTENKNELNLIAVANFYSWHGYDRLIYGLSDYYKNNTEKTVYIHLVGDGEQLNFYKNLVNKFNLSNYIIFYGIKSGEELSLIFNKSDIAVCSLGGHRKSIFLSSELKSREYMARGLPMLSSTKIDVLPDNYKYCLFVPENESPIDINSIIQFYNNLINENNINQITNKIRLFAEKYCDMNITLKPVIEYLSKL
ncbi:MAG: glycosyltransferase [Treponema sp.]|nr:glycosyltransferase [Treponema sp.]MCL2250379.1 glycosyltransferase [Treponema sp.]